jgi:hypothetical protein
MSGFDPEDQDTFFDTDVHEDGAEALITGEGFRRRINVIFDDNTQAVAIYSDTDVEAAAPVFEAKSTDLSGVKRGMAVSFPKLKKHEDGFGKSYEVARIAGAGVQTSKVYLKEL